MDSWESIWQRGSARQIMRDARVRFEHASLDDLSDAYVSLASVHYSLVKRYLVWWKKPLAVWHMWRALQNVRSAYAQGSVKGFSPTQFDIAARIITKAPNWLGGNAAVAVSMLNTALFLTDWQPGEMKPHTRALMFITLGEIEGRGGATRQAELRYAEARKLIPAIEIEDSEDREKQLVRVMTSIGLFYYDHILEDKYWSKKLLGRALNLAIQVSKDQEEKIRAELWKRGL